ncbi:hypothetical protein RF55_12198 [Lasius niger]|uniref:Uncharacterized protein n=1 Tax=Lasius niger TaxID=67767 RepID=A0A0J7KDR4_LASNI|nr:hypothetical protein RF55_12198 [Lasius niger]
MSPTKNSSEFTVQELKEKLRTFGLSTTGPKSELISRLTEADPAGGWLRESDDVQNDLSRDEEQDLDASGIPAMSLQENMIKILIGSRLKGKAAEWFRSKPEHIEMSADDLLLAMEAMFNHRPNKLARKKEFEGRIWKRGESFGTYMHDKIILANRVPIEEDDLVDYIVDGIMDTNPQDQARIQGFTTTASLLKAFEKITIRPRGQRDSIAAPRVRPEGIAAARPHEGAKQRRSDGGEQYRPKKCYNCGGQNHLSVDCPTKESGIKCYRCDQRGHVAAKCIEKTSTRVSDDRHR